ncbi:MAG TPA: ABC transporter permease [Gemmatimonadota bacterium]|nr:ABC transporter permease [Gemmatimonadota bacterium]
MNFWEALSSALHSLRGSKLRSFLTLLGIIVAVTSIIAVVTVIQGLNSKVSELVTGRGADVFVLDRIGTSEAFSSQAMIEALSRPELTAEDAEALSREGTTLAYVAAEVATREDVWGGSRKVEDMNINGVGPEYPYLSTFEIARGRHLSPLEIDRARPVAVIGEDVAKELFPTRDPLGEMIRVRGRHFEVIGVAKPQGSTFGVTQDDFVVIPLEAWQKIFSRRESVSISIKAADPNDIQSSIDEARMIMRARHDLRPSEPDDFGFMTTQELLDLYQKITTGVYSALVGLVAISLVIGGIVVMNIMLVAVTERTREIGIRKAIGARGADIMRQFLTEAVILSALGGLAGVALGFGIAILIAQVTPLPYALKWWSIALGIGVSSLVGIVFGIYPAAKASRLDPIEALRHE